MHAIPHPICTAAQSGFRARRLTLPIFTLASFFILLAQVSHAQVSHVQVPQILLSDGYSSITEHQIGNHLFTGLQGGASEATYLLELRDESGWVVAATTVVTDQKGDAEPVALWEYSGFHCEPCPVSGSCPYSFTSLAAAEAILANRAFAVYAIDASEVVVASATLPLVMRTTVLITPTDVDGCPVLTLAEDEDLFVAGDDLAPIHQSMRLWVVEYQINWQVGDSLFDLRPAYSKGQLAPLVGPQLPPLFAWLDPFPSKDFCVVAQLYTSPNPPVEPFIRVEDLAPGRIQCVAITGAQPEEPWG